MTRPTRAAGFTLPSGAVAHVRAECEWLRESGDGAVAEAVVRGYQRLLASRGERSDGATVAEHFRAARTVAERRRDAQGEGHGPDEEREFYRLVIKADELSR